MNLRQPDFIYAKMKQKFRTHKPAAQKVRSFFCIDSTYMTKVSLKREFYKITFNRFIERVEGATNSHDVWPRRIDLPIRFAKFVGNMLPGKCTEVRRVS